MIEQIKIKKKVSCKEYEERRTVSVRMKEEMVERLDELSVKTNRSRNELINILLDSAIDLVTIEE